MSEEGNLGGTKTIVSDGVASYLKAIPRVFPSAHHQRSIRFQDVPSNIIIKRFFSTFKPRYHLMRGLKSLKRAQEFLDAFAIYYNHLRTHKSLRDNPPYKGLLGRNHERLG